MATSLPVARRRRVSVHCESWRDRYVRNIKVTDFAVVCFSVLAGALLRFGNSAFSARIDSSGVPLYCILIGLILSWTLALGIAHSRDVRVLGAGPAEYSRTLNACLGLFGALAVAGLLAGVTIARGFWAIVFAVGTLSLLGSRWLWRRHLVRGRRSGRYMGTVLVLGPVSSAEPVIEHLVGHPSLGYRVAGLCIPTHDHSGSSVVVAGREIPVLGDLGQVRETVARYGASAVAVTSSDSLGFAAMRELSWRLNEVGVEMLVAPCLLDIAAPRILLRPAAGLPLLVIDKPQYERATKALKRCFDLIFALGTLAFVLPVMAACAVAIRWDTSGPVFYRGERIGLNNAPFRMWKFRSMVVGAEDMKSALVSQNEGHGVLFKIHDDPRVTRVGRFLRRYSLDELPQLFNVLAGEMSLVGPRPPLRHEVEEYDTITTRRMFVRPGMTGLWQVSGRSDLSWDESVRLDLMYVENWSLPGDLIILWRTFLAVAARVGAY